MVIKAGKNYRNRDVRRYLHKWNDNCLLFPTISFQLVLNIFRFSDFGVYPGNSIGTGDRISEHA